MANLVQNNRILFFTLLTLLLVLVFTEVLYGPAGMTVGEFFHALLNPDSANGVIVWNLRIPRMIYAFCTGAGLGVCGLALQGVFRNPLADPFTLGISGGAALGGAIASLLGVVSGILVSAGAFAGSILVCSVVYMLAQQAYFSKTALILGGVIIGYFFQALLMLSLSILPSDRAQGVLVWLMGDLGSADQKLMLPTILLCFFGYILLSRQSKGLNLLVMGEEKAASLGEDVAGLRRRVFIWCSVITGACVAAVGIIGFVGLIIPHVVRRMVGPNHTALFPLTALMGASFVLTCDLASRWFLAPIELPLGVVTGIIGSVSFFWILIRQRRFEL